MPYSIAIDGPAGAGKSTLARSLAKELGYIYVDTGAMYRAMGLYCVENGIPLLNEERVNENSSRADIQIGYGEDGAQKVYLNGRDVSSQIRTEEIGEAASAVSKYPGVRERLVALQRKIAEENSVVMDGRDIGTKVLPDAKLKIYLTASPRARAERRMKDYLARGERKELSEIEELIRRRDEQDMNREHSPLRKAEDAVELDTTTLGIEETLDRLLALALGSSREGSI